MLDGGSLKVSACTRRTGGRNRARDMRNTILAILVAANAGVLASAAFADSGAWTDREICRAAVKTYFFLGRKPTDSADSGKYFGFRSSSGNIYTCRIVGMRAEFRWVNASGGNMESGWTRFQVFDNALVVKTDMKEEVFRTK